MKGAVMDAKQLRSIVWEVLAKVKCEQTEHIHTEVRNRINNQYYPKLLVSEIIWELLLQGVIAPGFNDSNLQLPFIHLTEYGKECIEAGEYIPQDKEGYLSRLQADIGRDIDDIVLLYLRESLQTFARGSYLSSVLTLGVASERCVDLLETACAEAISNPEKKSAFAKSIKNSGRSVKRRFDTVRELLLGQDLTPELKDALDIQLSGIFTLMRYTRNDAGHPTGRVFDRDTAHAGLLLFPQYCKRVYDLVTYLQEGKL